MRITIKQHCDIGVFVLEAIQDRILLEYDDAVEVHKALAEFIDEMDRRDKTPEVLA
jgi:hypothetical protein